ncbi:MAG TPA: HupE/UreJ family protein [Blastocatellia bacterium]|nr:HupE/UreJ family protein [Blastocatellia bacterium]
MQRNVWVAGRRWLMAFLLLASGVVSPRADAHPQPMTRVVLDLAPHQVAMNLHLPLGELELAFGHRVNQDPEVSLPDWQAPLNAYLIGHLHPTTDGRPWTVEVMGMAVQRAEQMQSGPFQEVLVHLLLTPPVGASTRKFTLNYDVILHQVVTHKALVSIHNDWERGQTAEEQVGMIEVNTQTTLVEPLEINLGAGSLWDGFKGMVGLGMQHIKEGTDHLLFLLALLLPATLLVNGRRWGAFGGSRYSLARLLKIVTAFTVGHSVTLLAGALGWLRLPPQPVEVLIAVSILVSAVHAFRPLFPGKETHVAAGFGLVHGLAFATVLADLRLNAGRMALSILGFNLGIELMQLFVMAVTVPWLILLSLTPIYVWVRVVSAALAAVAALGWIVSRVSGQSNVIDRSTQVIAQYAPVGILLLALLALPAYLHHSIKRRSLSSLQEKS